MEARVKERLTGAVVLVAIVIIVVPELLSGPKRNAAPPPGSHTVQIDLTGPHRVAPASPVIAPPAPASGTVMSVRPDGPSVPVNADPAAAEPVPEAKPEPKPAAPPASRPPPDPAATSDAPPPGISAAASPPPAPTPAAAPAAVLPAPAHAPAASGPATTHAAAPPAAVPAAPRPALSGAAPTAVSGWVVQLGSFASRDNAQKLVQELHHKGYSAFLAEYRGNGKVLFRVRVGPEQDRARADALRLRLGHEGYTGSVTPHP